MCKSGNFYHSINAMIPFWFGKQTYLLHRESKVVLVELFINITGIYILLGFEFTMKEHKYLYRLGSNLLLKNTLLIVNLNSSDIIAHGSCNINFCFTAKLESLIQTVVYFMYMYIKLIIVIPWLEFGNWDNGTVISENWKCSAGTTKKKYWMSWFFSEN